MLKRTLNIITLFLLMSFVMHTADAQDAQSKKPSIYDIHKMSFSKESFSEISPVILNDGLVFCSNRRFSSFTDRTSFNGDRLYNIYLVQEKDSSWNTPKEIKSEFSSRFTNGPLSISADGKTVYFTSEVEKGNVAKKKGFRNKSGIFIADLNGTDLQNVRPFKYNNIQFNIGHPSISRDGKYLFFASDMPGGQGNSDIWYCELINGEWSAPVNLGPKVNSSAADLYPYMHPSGKLYFSSDRTGGTGRLDIYSTSLYYGKWEAPVHLQEPINSTYDDFSIVATDNLSTGYFSSNRGNSDDIYKFTSTMIRKSSCDTLIINSYWYRFFEENAVKFDTMPFRYEWRFGDGEKADGPMVIHHFKGPGQYIVQLDIVNLITKEIIHNEKNDTLNIVDAEQPYISCQDTISVGNQIKLNANGTNLPGWKIARYYWNFGDETVDQGIEVGKTFTKPGNYNVQLIVTSEAEPDGTTKEACICKNIVVLRQP